MNIFKRKFLTLVIVTGLAACSAPVIEEEVVIIEPVLAEPVFETQRLDCDASTSEVEDGIGGTGCQVD